MNAIGALVHIRLRDKGFSVNCCSNSQPFATKRCDFLSFDDFVSLFDFSSLDVFSLVHSNDVPYSFSLEDLDLDEKEWSNGYEDKQDS